MRPQQKDRAAFFRMLVIAIGTLEAVFGADLRWVSERSGHPEQTLAPEINPPWTSSC